MATDKKAYRIGEGIRVTCKLQNIGTKPAYIPQQLLVGANRIFLGFEVRILDAYGREPTSTVAGHSFSLNPPPTAVQQVQTRSLLLPPDGFYGTNEMIFTDTYSDLKPGRYKVVVTYTSWGRDQFGANEIKNLQELQYPILVGEQRLEPVWVQILK